MWSSVIGMFVGRFLFPPWGMFFGALFGAIVGELLAGKERQQAFRAGWESLSAT
jgi:uncharacterized protein YqgC (DUF456 family)